MNQAIVSDADWAEIRSTTITAHEAPSLFSSVEVTTSEDDDQFVDDAGDPVSGYASELQLWEMKSGLYQDASQGRPRSLWSRIKWGAMDKTVEDLGLVSRPPEGTYIHPEVERMSSRPDMEVSEDQGQTWLPMVACNVAGMSQDGWRNAVGDWVVPEYMYIQMNHHMAVTGAERGYVVALIGGVTIRHFVVERDEELSSIIPGAIAGFWKFVEAGKRPRPNGARDAKVLSRLNANIDPATPIADFSGDTDFVSLVEKRASLSKQQGALRKEIAELTAQIAERMDGLSAAIINDTQMISRQTIPAREVSYKSKASSKLIVAKRKDSNAGSNLSDLAVKAPGKPRGTSRAA